MLLHFTNTGVRWDMCNSKNVLSGLKLAPCHLKNKFFSCFLPVLDIFVAGTNTQAVLSNRAR